MIRRVAIVLLAVAAGIAALALVLHTPFVRARVLRYALAEVQVRYGIRLEASRLDYNFATLRMGIADLRISAPAETNDPFFEADYLSVTLPGQALFGALAFDEIAVDEGLVRVVRRRDGTTNLPETWGTADGDPPPLRIAHLAIPRLAIDLRDEQADVSLQMPSVALELTPADGRLALGAPAEVRAGDRVSRISQLDGQVAFDGRALRLTETRLRAEEAAVRVDGTIALIARDPSIDLRVEGSADAGRLARWAVADKELPQGTLALDARLAGLVSDPRADLKVSSDRLTWRRFTIAALSAGARVSSAAADIQQLEFGFQGGRLSASGNVPFGSGASARLSASWSGIDAAGLVRALAPASEIVPSSVLSGRLDLEGPLVDVGRLSADARLAFDPRRSARGRIAVGGQSRLQLAQGGWRLDGRQMVGGVAPVTLALRGRASERATIAGTVSVDRTSVPGLLDVLRTTGLSAASRELITGGAVEADMQLAGRLADPEIKAAIAARDLVGARIDAHELDATLSGRPVEPRFAFALVSPGARIAGEAVSDVRSSGTVVGRTVAADELIARQPSTSGLLAGFARYDLETTQYSGSLAVNQWQVMPTEERPFGGVVNLRLGGAGTTSEPRGAADLSLREVMWQNVALGNVDAAVALDGRSATIRARAPDFRTEANARVQLDAPYGATIDVRADSVDLARVLRDIQTTVPIEGTAVIAAHAEGPLESWRDGSGTVDIQSLDAKAGELAIRLAEPARLRYELQRAHIDTLEATAGDTRVSASGELPIDTAAPDAALLLAVTGDVDEVARAVAATGITQVPITGGDGPVALLARVTGTLEAQVIAADLEVGPGSLMLRDLPSVSELRVRAHAEQGWIELREASASYQGARLSATGKAPLSDAGGERVLHARATNLTPRIVAPFVDDTTLKQLEGSVDATLDVQSQTLEPADLTGELRLDRLDVRIADLPVTQRTPTRIIARDGFARIEAWDWVGQGGTLSVRGQVRLGDRQAAILANGELDLRMLTPFVRGAGMTTAGRLKPRLSVTGALDDPRIDGDILVTGGEVRLADPRILVSDLGARAVLTRTSARLASLTGLVNGGPLTGSGAIELGEGGQLEAQLSTGIRGMALEFPQGLRSEIDAALNLRAGAGVDTRPYNGRLSGTVTVLRGAYRDPLAVVTGLLTTLRARRLAARVGSSPRLESLALDVRLLTDEDIIVDNNYGRFQLGGDLRVIGTAASPALSGRAELREGGQLFVGRNVYTIAAGTINFANPVIIEPDLNVQAVTRAGGEEIEVTITGTPDTIGVGLRSPSDPDLGQAELTSLLLTGRPLEDLAPGDAAFVGTQVLGNFSAEVLGFASQAVGLDSLRLGGVENAALRRDQTAAATELDPTTRLTFGKSLGPDVDLTFSQSLRDGDAQTWIVDYSPVRRLELRLVSDDEDLRSYGFRHDVAYGGGPGSAASTERRARREAVRVAAVNLTGDLIFPEPHVRGELRLDAGDRFDFGAWQEDRDRLERFYRREGHLTARVAATRSDGPDGMTLTYHVTAGPRTQIVVMGLDVDSQLRACLEEAWAESVFDDFLVEEVTEIVKGVLASRGYLQPVVDARITEEDSEVGRVPRSGPAAVLTIAIEPGARTGSTTVRIEGADEGLTRQLETWLGASDLIESAATDPGRLEREITAYLRSNGHLQARVTAGAPLFEGASAVVTVKAAAGPVFTMASIAFEGTEALAIDAVSDAVGLAEGDPYDPAVADAARDRLVALYRRQAYPSPAVTVRPSVRTDARAVDLTFAIDAGVRQTLGEVVVSGNRAIDSDVIVRALELPLNEPLRAEPLLQARRRVFDTGLFRRVDLESEPIGPPAQGGRETPMRVRVAVEEWPALRLRYGLQIAEERPEGEIKGRDLVPGLSADLTRRTLFGRAIAVGGALELQRRERQARGFINAPMLLGWPIESSLSLNRTWRTVGTTDRADDRIGVSWEQRLRFVSNLQLSYGYRFERSRTDVPSDPIIGPLPPIVLNIARVSSAASWDTRDDPSETTRGSLVSYSLEFAPETAGSDIRFIRHVAQAYNFRPWRDLVFASAARVGMVRPLGGQDLILSERFFSGGAGTVRGVAEDRLGQRDFFGDPLGGEALLVLNQEVRLPIYRWLRGVGFIDAGNVFATPGDIGLRRLVGSVGFGLRLATPFALLRADYAKPVWAGSLEGSGRWNFGIGHAF